MNVVPERAREACESCRKSHKKCMYDDNSTRCGRCEKRNTPCSLFISVQTTAVAQAEQDPPLLTAGSAPDSWAALATPHASSSSSTFSYQFNPDYYWANAALAGNAQGEYHAADMIYQSSANQHDGDQPAMDQASLYGHNNVFGTHGGG